MPVAARLAGASRPVGLDPEEEEAVSRVRRIRVAAVRGACNARLEVGDTFQLESLSITPRGNDRVCFLAVSQLPIGQGVWQLQSEERFFSHVSCPGCIAGPERENRVVFLLGHADRWRLCQLISEYLELSKSAGEPEAARQLSQEAIAHQKRGEYDEAAHKTELALQELRRALGPREETDE